MPACLHNRTTPKCDVISRQDSDHVILSVSLQLIDERVSIADGARRSDAMDDGGGGAYLLVRLQLEEKQQRHEAFLEFVRATQLLQPVCSITGTHSMRVLTPLHSSASTRCVCWRSMLKKCTLHSSCEQACLA